ncbi:MAG: hypothetical protein IJ410_05445 [Oscillospiraceae bacterium]|nr:hypothetical protein [Oscillospiraceae bacterium]
MDRRDIIIKQIARYGILCLSVFVLYILQSIPGFLSVFGIKPVLIMPFCITLSMLDENWQSGIVYLVGGLLTDLSCGRVVGTFSIQMLLVCVAGMIAVKFFFRPSRRNFYLFSFVSMVIMLTVDFLFSYVMSGDYTSMLFFYIKNVVLLSAYSALFSQLFYVFIDYIGARFMRFDAR